VSGGRGRREHVHEHEHVYEHEHEHEHVHEHVYVYVYVYVVLIGLAFGGCSSKRAAPARGEDAAVAMIDAAPAPEVRELVVLRRITVDVTAPQGAPAPSEDAIRTRLGRLGGGVVATADARPPGTAARTGTLDAVLTYDRGGTPKAPSILMTIEASLDLGDALGVAARAAGERAVEKAGEAAAVDALASTLVEQVATELAAKLALRALTSTELVAAAAGIESPSELAAWTLELGAERRIAALRPTAEAALAAKPRSARMDRAAIQYFVALGDPTAVPLLADSADFNDPAELASIIEAVTALGGDEAIEFLEMLAAGSTDVGLAERAKQGIERIRRRATAP
jgi:hypothetical protein